MPIQIGDFVTRVSYSQSLKIILHNIFRTLGFYHVLLHDISYRNPDQKVSYFGTFGVSDLSVGGIQPVP